MLLLLHDGARALAPRLEICIALLALLVALASEEGAILAQLADRALGLFLRLADELLALGALPIGVERALRLEVVIEDRIVQLDRRDRGTLQQQRQARVQRCRDGRAQLGQARRV